MPRVKICGVKRAEDIQAVIAAGADAVGLNFVARSPRFVGNITAAEKLIRDAHAPESLLWCGVFVNASLKEIQSTAEALKLAVVQLHGDESPEFAAEIRRLCPSVKIWKAMRIGAAEDLNALRSFNCDGWVLDSKVEGVQGGSGKTFDWTWLEGIARPVELIMSGGLNPGNVAEAIRRTAPDWVDVASGVESAPGVKDQELLLEFIIASKQ